MAKYIYYKLGPMAQFWYTTFCWLLWKKSSSKLYVNFWGIKSKTLSFAAMTNTNPHWIELKRDTNQEGLRKWHKLKNIILWQKCFKRGWILDMTMNTSWGQDSNQSIFFPEYICEVATNEHLYFLLNICFISLQTFHIKKKFGIYLWLNQ